MLLAVKDLSIVVNDLAQEKTIVDGISFEVKEKTVTALVGGSGSGKTTTGLATLQLLPSGLSIKRGEVIFKNENLATLPQERLRNIRGKDIAMVFQEPLSAFNPLFTIGAQIEEVLMFHTDLNSTKRQARVFEILNLVGIDEAKRIYNQYPHHLSGGLRQRAMIAQALAANPSLMIADEPTSNLDVTLQAKVIDLFRKLKAELNLSILLITHDLGMVEHLADEVVVMKQGKIVEQGTTKNIIQNPQHPYTQKLIEVVKV